MFGKDEVIRSCCPGYITDAIYRIQNLDRYDDRLQVTTNLIEAYELLMDKVTIEKDWLKTENRCIPRHHGNIMSDEFIPYPKNPLIQQFFANIGRTDTIGSGVRNLYKYTPIYSDGGKPELIEDDVFKISIPLDKVAAEEGREQKTLSEREQKIYNMICENLNLSVEQVMAQRYSETMLKLKK